MKTKQKKWLLILCILCILLIVGIAAFFLLRDKDNGLALDDNATIGIMPGVDIAQRQAELQEQLDAIATVYTAIPRVAPDGFYGPNTAASVREFQSVFGLPQTGVVDFPTWYKISHIYVAVTRIAELT